MNIAVLDLETDPFEYGVIVQPFLAGFYDGKRTVSYWGPNCIERLVAFLKTLKGKWVIYAHNGGRFDFFYFLSHLARGSMRIINGRIVQARIGNHELRDSYAIMPFPLADYDKDTIDYDKMRAENRENARDEILRYFQKDLTSLYELVTAFNKEFGNKLTIGATSMNELKKRCPFTIANRDYDKKFRKDFYFGGRIQVFKGGLTRGDLRVYDVNSMYPDVMCNCLHPSSLSYSVSTRVESDTALLIVEGHNNGAFPLRQKNGGLDFTTEYGRFAVTIHEWQAALETGTFRPHRIITTYGWDERRTFEEFVNPYYDARAKCKAEGDLIRYIFYKYLLNSAYGKFAQNPERYFDWYITDYGDYPPDWHVCSKSCPTTSDREDGITCTKLWHPDYIFELKYMIWKRPLQKLSWYNVATGASITGAARAKLLRGICATQEPLYCDTDSIICCGGSRVPVHASRLGFWALEATGSLAAIAGKKLYALFDRDVVRVETANTIAKKAPPEIFSVDRRQVALVKKAHKGARLSGAEILRIAKGETITAKNPVPHFRWDGKTSFTERRIKRTG